MTDITRIIAERWRDVGSLMKAFYERKNAEAKASYEQEMALYVAKYGEIQKKTRTRKALGGGSSLFQMNHRNSSSDDDD